MVQLARDRRSGRPKSNQNPRTPRTQSPLGNTSQPTDRGSRWSDALAQEKFAPVQNLYFPRRRLMATKPTISVCEHLALDETLPCVCVLNDLGSVQQESGDSFCCLKCWNSPVWFQMVRTFTIVPSDHRASFLVAEAVHGRKRWNAQRPPLQRSA
jgi:hypothetical protein